MTFTRITIHHKPTADIMVKFATRDVKWTDRIKDIKNKFYLTDQVYIEFDANPTRGILNPIDTQDDESQTIASVYLNNLTNAQRLALTSMQNLDIWVKIKSRSLVFFVFFWCFFI